MDFYRFLVRFLEAFPEYKQRPIYLAGEDYSGHYIPIIVEFLHEMDNEDITLAGVAIGNGWVDPFYQYPAYTKYAVENGITNNVRGFLYDIGFNICQFSLMLEIPFLSRAVCDLTMIPLSGNPFHYSFNVYDIRRECIWMSDDCYPADGLSFYLSSRKFKSQLVGA